VTSAQDLYSELAFYTLAHGDSAFIHQHVVDAFAVQHADENTKPIAVVFGLAGLYLHIEKGFTGRQVQLAHMRMATRSKQWPQIPLPEKRGEITIEMRRSNHGALQCGRPARNRGQSSLTC
jgi:hypothetical protein